MATITLIVGPQNAGKTTKMLRIYESLTKGSAQGVAQPKLFDTQNRCVGYALRNLADATQYPLIAFADAASPCPDGWFAYGPFVFCAATFQRGVDLLDDACFDPRITTLLIDEIGEIEVGGRGYDRALRNALRSSKDVFLAVSDVHLDRILDRYDLHPNQGRQIRIIHA